jgi:hypothetical protein
MRSVNIGILSPPTPSEWNSWRATIFIPMVTLVDLLCGLVVWVPGCRTEMYCVSCEVQSSWLQIQRLGFDSRCYQIFWAVVGLERGPLGLVSTVDELLERKSGSGQESREYVRRNPSRWPRGTLYPQELALISPTSGGRLVGIVRLRTQAAEFYFLIVFVVTLVRVVSLLTLFTEG